MQPSSEQPGSREMSPNERRNIGAAYLHAYVQRDIDELKRLADMFGPDVLLAGMCTAARAMVIHIADLEGTKPDVVTGAYRDVWSQAEPPAADD